jgi:hypothetical protein
MQRQQSGAILVEVAKLTVEGDFVHRLLPLTPIPVAVSFRASI